MRVELLDALSSDAPVSHISSAHGKFLAATANRFVYTQHIEELSTKTQESLPACILGAKAGPTLFAVSCSDGSLHLRSSSTPDSSAPAIRVHEPDDDNDMVALFINDDSLAIGSGCFVLILDLERVWNDLQRIMNSSVKPLEIPLQSEWGVMHKLHSAQIRDLTLSSESRFVISAGEDGLICVADRRQMDVLNPELIRSPSLYDDELHDASENLLLMCVGINASVQQIQLVDNQHVIVLTDTHEIGVYKFDFSNAAQDGTVDFDVISQPNRLALEAGDLALSAELAQFGIDVESGITDIAAIVCAAHTSAVYAVITHSAGGICLVKVFEPGMTEQDSCHVIEGLSAEYARSADYIGDKLVVGTDSGNIYIEKEQLAKRLLDGSELPPSKLSRIF